MRPDKPRDPVAGPDAGPEAPYPVRLSGPVIKGFGRGSKDVRHNIASVSAVPMRLAHMIRYTYSSDHITDSYSTIYS